MMYKIVAIINDVLKEVRKDKLGAFAAQTTFFLVLSALPFFILFSTIIQHTAINEEQLYRLIELSIPEYVAPYIISIVEEMYSNSAGVLSVAIIGAIWSSSKGVHFLSNGLNEIYDIQENRYWIFLRIRAIGYTLVFVVGILFSIIFLMLGKIVRRELLSQFPIVNHIVQTLLSFRHLILLLVLFMLFLFILKYLPNRKASFRSLVIPAAVAAICWVLLSVGISIYVDFFDGFSMYGSMTTIMLILMYIYFGMYILLMCAQLDSMYGVNLQIWWKNRRKSS